MTEPSLFDEMDQAAAEIYNGWGRLADLQMEFRQLQKARYPDVSEQEWRDLFDHNEAKSEMRIAVLLAERDALNGARASLPPAERAAVDKRLNQGNRREPRRAAPARCRRRPGAIDRASAQFPWRRPQYGRHLFPPLTAAWRRQVCRHGQCWPPSNFLNPRPALARVTISAQLSDVIFDVFAKCCKC